MDTTRLVWLAVPAIVFAAIMVFVTWLGRRGSKGVLDQTFRAADANTKAIEENTAAIRELIAKLDARKP